MSDSQPWWIVAFSAIPPLLIAVWQRWRDSADKRNELEAQERQREQAERQRLMASMDGATLASFQRLEEDLRRERTRRQECEAETDRLQRELDETWDLARAWRTRAAICTEDRKQDRRALMMNGASEAVNALPPIADLPPVDKPTERIVR